MNALARTLVVFLSVCLVAAGFPAAPARPARAEAGEAAEPREHFLRDAVPVTWTAEPPDTVVDDDFFLPEETDHSKLYRDIAVFIVASAFVAFFIIKVFIEQEDDEGDDGSNGKPITPPQ